MGFSHVNACVTDELYEDEDCQIIKPEVNDVVAAFMLGRIDDCPYFKENESGNYVCHNDFEENVECPEEYIDTCQVGTQD